MSNLEKLAEEACPNYMHEHQRSWVPHSEARGYFKVGYKKGFKEHEEKAKPLVELLEKYKQAADLSGRVDASKEIGKILKNYEDSI